MLTELNILLVLGGPKVCVRPALLGKLVLSEKAEPSPDKDDCADRLLRNVAMTFGHGHNLPMEP